LPVLLLGGALEEEILVTLSPEIGKRMLASGATPGTPVVRRLADSLRRLIPAASATVLPVLLFPSPARYYISAGWSQGCFVWRWWPPEDSSVDTFAAGGDDVVRKGSYQLSAFS
jgi:hypothetical protein